MGLRDFIGIIRELSFEDIRAESRIAPRLLVVARTVEDAEQHSRRLFGDGAGEYVDAISHDNQSADPLVYDAIVSSGPLNRELARRWQELFKRANEPMRLVEINLARTYDDRHLHQVRRRIADAADDRALAIGRYIPSMQIAAAEDLVAQTSRVNGQFALASNIPTLVPVVGNVIAVGADFFVLTKNQLMMMYKLAAIYNQNLDNQWRVYGELLPVVGAGLVWRTIARELAALLPLAIGTVPKVAIAFAGTWALGQAARIYYEQGRKINRDEMRSLYSEALEILRRNPISARRNGREHLNGATPEIAENRTALPE